MLICFSTSGRNAFPIRPGLLLYFRIAMASFLFLSYKNKIHSRIEVMLRYVYMRIARVTPTKF